MTPGALSIILGESKVWRWRSLMGKMALHFVVVISRERPGFTLCTGQNVVPGNRIMDFPGFALYDGLISLDFEGF